ncbi:uncharacterized protein FOMMEDRAFT_118009 [Fomitiporia mediterranea MF3/22]|uniref:uncharacterized protein n=1 Tax=Fomitiporia mediterranea (strain MF3/22) TaxID=694068 RepID=UPI00044087BA|nr:uncharacterized protein FOMMEDRAFT_118009 [Fomitiporia mediterranea MF3/22]EJD06953.1 hypothetical protein FOMMEDRAFT_118009 [Fomitiporia mediterranea MF3/22]
MGTMPLLTPTESYKFQSALLDYSNGIASPEWTMYTTDVQEEYSDRQLPPRREGSEQLAKATKDLISLDSNPSRWNESADREVLTTDLPVTSPLNMVFKPPAAPTSYAIPSPLQRITSPLQQLLGGQHQQVQRPPLTVTPSHTLENSAASDSQQSVSSVSSDPTPPPPTPPALKRPYPSSSDLSNLAGPSSSSDVTTSTARHPCKKQRGSPPHQQGPVLNAKPSLLSASQKKANHIQSEQKRRANIRRGYEALCETVPALREAISAEEQELAAEAAENEQKGGKGKSKKKSRAKRGMSESGEKMDGRAGPRSENVVLQKTIDYIHDLLDERKSLLDRLNSARRKLAPEHPALVSLQSGNALWEREWTGGQGILEDDGSDDEDES